MSSTTKKRRAARPRQVPAAETRALLVEAALGLIAERGVAGVSVRDVAAEAGVNHGLVHRYFGAKDGLVRAAVERMASLIYDPAAPPRASWFFERLSAHPELARLVARACLDGPHDLLRFAAPPPALLDALLARISPVASRVGADPAVLNALWTAALLGWHVFGPALRAGYRLPPDADAQVAALIASFDRLAG